MNNTKIIEHTTNIPSTNDNQQTNDNQPTKLDINDDFYTINSIEIITSQ